MKTWGGGRKRRRSLHSVGSGDRTGPVPHSFQLNNLDTFGISIGIDARGKYSIDSTYHVPGTPDRTESKIDDFSSFTNGEHRFRDYDWTATYVLGCNDNGSLPTHEHRTETIDRVYGFGQQFHETRTTDDDGTTVQGTLQRAEGAESFHDTDTLSEAIMVSVQFSDLTPSGCTLFTYPGTRTAHSTFDWGWTHGLGATYTASTFTGTWSDTVWSSWSATPCAAVTCSGSSSDSRTYEAERVEPYQPWYWYGWSVGYGGHPQLGILAIELGHHLVYASLHIDLEHTLATRGVQLADRETPATATRRADYPSWFAGQRLYFAPPQDRFDWGWIPDSADASDAPYGPYGVVANTAGGPFVASLDGLSSTPNTGALDTHPPVNFGWWYDGLGPAYCGCHSAALPTGVDPSSPPSGPPSGGSSSGSSGGTGSGSGGGSSSSGGESGTSGGSNSFADPGTGGTPGGGGSGTGTGGPPAAGPPAGAPPPATSGSGSGNSATAVTAVMNCAQIAGIATSGHSGILPLLVGTLGLATCAAAKAQEGKSSISDVTGTDSTETELDKNSDSVGIRVNGEQLCEQWLSKEPQLLRSGFTDRHGVWHRSFCMSCHDRGNPAAAVNLNEARTWLGLLNASNMKKQGFSQNEINTQADRLFGLGVLRTASLGLLPFPGFEGVANYSLGEGYNIRMEPQTQAEAEHQGIIGGCEYAIAVGSYYLGGVFGEHGSLPRGSSGEVPGRGFTMIGEGQQFWRSRDGLRVFTNEAEFIAYERAVFAQSRAPLLQFQEGPFVGGGGTMRQLSPEHVQAIQRFADQTGSTTILVGSRAAGTADALSDFDYIIQPVNNRIMGKTGWLLPRGPRVDTAAGPHRGFDVLKMPLDADRPHVIFSPRK